MGVTVSCPAPTPSLGRSPRVGLKCGRAMARSTPTTTYSRLRGSYEPPLGALGQHVDRLLMHRVAEATIRSFMLRLAESLTTTVDEDND